ncbi:MAG: GNAT family N-acetyltransferase [Pseudorhodobacter sp.]|nr:GNAT family N-acetyltransferase [Pseudorhodobacter sp.]
MTAARPVIAKESPLGPDLAHLMARHTADMYADTPPGSIHMMDARQLAIPSVAFYVMRLDAEPVAMGAFKTFAPAQAEIKSMHVLAEHRGKGLSRLMLDHLLAEALLAGLTSVSLETGAQAMFEPARRLYLRAAFTECVPFADYRLDPNSVYMTRTLA